jgi:hypothetical protein
VPGVKKKPLFSKKVELVRMLRKVLITYLTLAMITTAVTPRRSDALVGTVLLSGGTAAVILGAVVLSAGVVSSVLGMRDLAESSDLSKEERTTQRQNGVLLFLGILLLEQETGDYAFGNINDQTAKKLRVTPTEQIAYNNELTHLNLIREIILASWNSGKLKTIEDVSNEWARYQDVFTDEAWTAFQKVLIEVSKHI